MKTSPEIERQLIDVPIQMEWKNSDEMEYLKITFSNEKSAENLIIKSLKIYENPLIVLPYFPDKSILELLYHHKIRVTSNESNDLVDSLMLYQIFSSYGDIVNIIEECNRKFIIIFAHQNSVKKITIPSVIQDDRDLFQLNIDHVDIADNFPVKRLSLNDTLIMKYSMANLKSENKERKYSSLIIFYN